MAVPHYRVTTMPAPPFVMEKKGGGYQGFVVDLLTQIAKQSGFNFTMYPSKDGTYGALEENGRWSGMIGEVYRQETDIAAADLSITSNREEVVDFTKPFLSQTTKILTRIPSSPGVSLRLGFLLKPFSLEIWFSICIAIVLVALLFMLIGRFNPYEWRHVSPDKDLRGARHSFGLRDGLMFVFSTLLFQGYRETPRSLSGRTLAVSWFIFVFFIVVSYIGGVVTFTLSHRGRGRMLVPYSTVEDLAAQTEVEVGAVRFGRNFQLLENSKNDAYRRLASFITSRDTFVNTTSEGIKKVRESDGRFVMLMESLTAEYIVDRQCDLMVVGRGIFPSSFGFAVAKRSSLLDAINMALLRLTEDGTIRMLQERWWKFGGCLPPTNVESYGSSGEPRFVATEMTIYRLAIPFFILMAGAILAVVILLGEVIFKKKRSYWSPESGNTI